MGNSGSGKSTPRQGLGGAVGEIAGGDGWVIIRQVLWRSIRRRVTREELWNGNREPLSGLFRLERSDLEFIRIGSRKDAERLID